MPGSRPGEFAKGDLVTVRLRRRLRRSVRATGRVSGVRYVFDLFSPWLQCVLVRVDLEDSGTRRWFKARHVEPIAVEGAPPSTKHTGPTVGPADPMTEKVS